MPEKRCTRCDVVKLLDEFTKHPATRDRRGSWCKACTRTAAKKIYAEHREEALIQARERYARNRDSVMAASRVRYQANREVLVAAERRRRALRKANGIKPRISAQSAARQRQCTKQWARRNAEWINAYHRAYYARQPGKSRGWQHARRARLKGNGGTFTNAEWVALCARYGGRCLACGQEEPLTVDHVIPISRGGANSIDNIQPLCKPCNSQKHQQIIDYRRVEA